MVRRWRLRRQSAAIPADAPPLALDPLIADVRPVTAQVPIDTNQLQEWPAGLEGRLTGEDATRAVSLLSGAHRDYVLLNGNLHHVNLIPPLPDIRDPDCGLEG